MMEANLEDSPIEMEAQELNQSSIHSESEESEAEPSKRGYGTTVCGFIYKYGQERGFVLGADTLVTCFKNYRTKTGVVQQKRVEVQTSRRKIVHIGANIFMAVAGSAYEADILIGALRKYVGETGSPTYQMVVDHSTHLFMRRYRKLRRKNRSLNAQTLNESCVQYLLASMVGERPMISCVKGIMECMTDDEGFIIDVSPTQVPCFTCIGNGTYGALNVFLKFGSGEDMFLTEDIMDLWEMEENMNLQLQEAQVPFHTAVYLVKKAITNAIITSDGSGYSVFFLYRNNFGEGYEKECRPTTAEPLEKIRRRLGKDFSLEPQKYAEEKRAEEEDCKRRKERELKDTKNKKQTMRLRRNFLRLPIKRNFLMFFVNQRRVSCQRRARRSKNRRAEPLEEIKRRSGKVFSLEPQKYAEEKRAEEEDCKRAEEEDCKRTKEREEIKDKKRNFQAKRRQRSFLMPIKRSFMMFFIDPRRARTRKNRRGKENNSRLNGNTNHCDEVDVICSSQEKLYRKASTIKEPILQSMKRQKAIA